MNMLIGFGAGLLIALVLGHFVGVLGWVVGLVAAPRSEAQSGNALAVRAGINALAIPSDAALDTARQLGVEISYRDSCCSLVTANQPREERP